MDWLLNDFNQHMQILAFEKAAVTHKNMETLEKLQRKSQKWFRIQENQDALVLIRAFHAPECYLFVVKQGHVVSRTYLSSDMSEREKAGLIRDAIHQNQIPMDDWLTQCVSEVFADKHFLNVPKPIWFDFLLHHQK